ncbi:hypothetical protein G9A89_015143 [Geosiphon pyriformis]|nr:hypothetical protein G9A89_015143 [Geosiphon pyriformis]
MDNNQDLSYLISNRSLRLVGRIQSWIKTIAQLAPPLSTQIPPQENIPLEIFVKICYSLPPHDLYSLMRVCRYFHQILSNHDDYITETIWRTSRVLHYHALSMSFLPNMNELSFLKKVWRMALVYHRKEILSMIELRLNRDIQAHQDNTHRRRSGGNLYVEKPFLQWLDICPSFRSPTFDQNNPLAPYEASYIQQGILPRLEFEGEQISINIGYHRPSIFTVEGALKRHLGNQKIFWCRPCDTKKLFTELAYNFHFGSKHSELSRVNRLHSFMEVDYLEVSRFIVKLYAPLTMENL